MARKQKAKPETETTETFSEATIERAREMVTSREEQLDRKLSKTDIGLMLSEQFSDYSKDDIKKLTDLCTESKTEKFSRLASVRASRAVDAIRSLAALSNTASYECTEEQLTKIFNAIQERLNETQAAFENPGEKKKARVLSIVV